ncbi:MAG TPA: hypothetical protein VFR10_06360, partial [bacterium]|nr:hypothetical protein [bacterium]
MRPDSSLRGRISRCLLSLAALISVAGELDSVHAATIRVPQDQPTITDGMIAAQSGDSVLVDCGVYVEREIQMKSGVVLKSVTGDPECVTIDATEMGRVLLFEDTVVGTAVDGITITGGIRPQSDIGGGVLLVDSKASFRNCFITENSSGAGLWSRRS